MNLSEPALSVIPSVTGSVLAALARSTESMSGRALEERLKPKASHRGVQEALRRLVEAGIVHRVDKGGAALYSLNRAHLAASAIGQLARLRDELLNRMRNAISEWTVSPHASVLFGSLARGEGGPESDIDLLIIRPDLVERTNTRWRDQLVELNKDVWEWTGNPLRVIELSEAELQSESKMGEAYLDSASREGITLTGIPLSRLRGTT